MKLKERQIEAIKMLAKYKYLTSTQFVVLLVLYSQKGTLTKVLKELTDMSKPLVGKESFGTDPQKGKLSNIYFLTKYGANFLIEHYNYALEDIKSHNENSTFFKEDYFHRISTIDYNIKFDQWVKQRNGTVEFTDTYFDFIGGNNNKNNKTLRASTKIELENKFIIPDVISKFTINNKEYLFAFEQHNGKDSKKLINQLTQYCLALKEKTISAKYNHNKSIRVVVVFEYEGTKRSVIKRLAEFEIFQKLYNYFIFKTNEEMKDDFYHNWSLLNNQKVNFL